MKYQIFHEEPKDWKELQIFVAAILSDIGYECSIEKDIETVRGKANIDVHAESSRIQPAQLILAECKYWKKSVPKTVIHAFRTVVNDSGANFGYIISKEGFQSGSYDAAEKSNVSLMSWQEFQEFFKPIWVKTMLHNVHMLGKPLIDFTEYLGDFFDSEYEKLSYEKQVEFDDAVEKYRDFAWFSNKHYIENFLTGEIEYLDEAIEERKKKLPIEINCYKDYFYFLRDSCIEALKVIDSIFEKEIRKNQNYS